MYLQKKHIKNPCINCFHIEYKTNMLQMNFIHTELTQINMQTLSKRIQSNKYKIQQPLKKKFQAANKSGFTHLFL